MTVVDVDADSDFDHICDSHNLSSPADQALVQDRDRTHSDPDPDPDPDSGSDFGP